MASGASKSKPHPSRRQRIDGERSRNAILNEAARLATVEGISGLSLSRLADAVGMSKSGLFAHFGSKEELQLATIETADEIFDEQVREAASPDAGGLERLRALLDAYLRYVESGTFPGGCFFAAVMVEVSHAAGRRSRPDGRLHGRLARRPPGGHQGRPEGGDIYKSEDGEQLAFELEAFLLLANTQFAVAQDREPVKRGRRAIERRLEAATT